MSALEDPEDPPPMQAPSTGPLTEALRNSPTEPASAEEPLPPPPGVPGSLMPRTSAASTEPAPDAIAAAVAELLRPSIDNIWRELSELRLLRAKDHERLRAIDNGVGSSHARLGLVEDSVKDLAAIVERAAGDAAAAKEAAQRAADAALKADAAVVSLREGVAVRVAGVELKVDQNSERIERLDRTSSAGE